MCFMCVCVSAGDHGERRDEALSTMDKAFDNSLYSALRVSIN